MRLNILFGGEAGQGINVVASLVGAALSKKGYYVFNYREYPSLIRGGHNFNILSISNEKIGSHESKLDIVIALNEESIEKHQGKLRKGGFIIKKEDLDDKFKPVLNIVSAGVLFKILGLDLDPLIDELKKRFKGKKFLELDINAAKAGYNTKIEKSLELGKANKKELVLMSGSRGITKGAVASGIDIYLAYPMTPATPVLHYIAAEQIENNFLVFQPENEIAVANIALGAGHTGAKVMVGTSGGGYDLMTEAMSMQGMSEIPLVVYLSQRPGPATGVPTYSAQGDLDVATKSSHGEFPRVVIAPGDPVECIEKTNEAFYFAERFRTLAIVLGDKHVAESEFTFSEKPRIIKIKRNIEKGQGFYKNYKITQDGNSPRSVPGLAIVKSSGYEHNEFGITTEDSKDVKEMTDKRMKKQKTIEKAVRKFEMFKIHGNSKNLLIGWGSTKGAILDAIKDLDVKFLQVLYMEPFPDEIKKELVNAKKVLLVENNASALLGKLIAEKTGFMIKDKILRYDGRPFESDKLKEEIKKRL